MTWEVFMASIWLASGVSVLAIPFLMVRQHRLKQQLATQEKTIAQLISVVANGDVEAFQRAVVGLGELPMLADPNEHLRVPAPRPQVIVVSHNQSGGVTAARIPHPKKEWAL